MTLTDSRNAVVPHRRGYTLVEMLVVMIMVATMMAIALPQLRIAGSTRVQLAGMQLAQDLDLARTRALSTRSSSRVSFASSARKYTGYLDDNTDGTIGETIAERDALRAFATRELPDNVTFGRGSATAVPGDGTSTAITFASARVNFDARGLVTPTAAGGVVYLQDMTDPTAVTAVAVSPAGNMRLWTWRNGAWK